MASRRGAATWGAVVMVLGLLGLTGCGSGLKTYSVSGKVVHSDGDVKELTGSNVEFMLESDPLVRASGKIGPDGSFKLQTLHEGRIINGAPEGAYKARIILGEPGDEGVPKRSGRPVHPRFLDFEKSGLKFKVPTSGDVTINVSKK